MSRLKDKRFIITGAASGIGKAIVHRFVQEEASVLFTDLDKSAADKAVKETGSDLAQSFKLDVTRASDYEDAIACVKKSWGGLDGIVNNVGYGVAAQAPDTSEEEWDKVLGI